MKTNPANHQRKNVRSLMADSVEENLLRKYESVTAKIRHNRGQLLWWKYSGKIYLAVSRVTTKHLSVVTTSVHGEHAYRAELVKLLPKEEIARRQGPRSTEATRRDAKATTNRERLVPSVAR